MILARTAAELHDSVGGWRRDDYTVGFVPTMGALHEGHLALVRRATELADRVVVSIFVNPTQFGPEEDYESYPRDSEADGRLLEETGCDLVFLPDAETIYPEGHSTLIAVAGPARGLEGDYRPGHFHGVATVVTQLFHLVQPDLAVFGEKDAQQLAVLRRLVRDLHFPIELVAHPTVREQDGLALSSRNAYLDEEERAAATVLHRALTGARDLIEGGERSSLSVRALLLETLEAEPAARIDYAEVVDADSFQPIDEIAGEIVIPLAVWIGNTRLIDNLHLKVD